MPYPKEHAARMHPPSRYKSFARKNGEGGPGVDFVFGVLPDGKTEIQAVRFDEKKFTEAEAKKWLEDNNMKPILFEPAMKEEVRKGDSPDSLEVELIVKSAVPYNGQMVYELGYMLDGAKGGDPRNIISLSEPFEHGESFPVNAILKVACAGIEVDRVNSLFGIRLQGAGIISSSQDRKLPESAKAILQKAEFNGCLLASEYERNDLAEAGILRKVSRHLIMETDGESSLIKYEFPLYKDSDKQLVYGVVYEPFDGTNGDAHGDFASADEIEKAAHGFMKAQSLNIMHSRPLGEDQAQVVESYIAPADFRVGNHLIKKGSWVMVTHIADRALWKMVTDGTFNSYSMEGTGRTADFIKHADAKNKNISKRCLFDMVIKAVALVDKGANKKRFFLMKKDDTMNKEAILALIKSAGLTSEQAILIAKTANLTAVEITEIEKAATPAPSSEDILADKIVSQITSALEKVIKAAEPPAPPTPPAPPAGPVKAPPANATMDEKVAWYLANPDAEIPDDMLDAVATALANKKQQEMAQTE